jgi:hypothetical protein
MPDISEQYATILCLGKTFITPQITSWKGGTAAFGGLPGTPFYGPTYPNPYFTLPLKLEFLGQLKRSGRNKYRKKVKAQTKFSTILVFVVIIFAGFRFSIKVSSM